MGEEDGSGKQRQGGGTHRPQQSRSYGHVAEAASWLRAPSPRVQSPPEVLAPSAAPDLTEMQNRALPRWDESFTLLISHVVKAGFREVLLHQEQGSSNMLLGTKGESGCCPQGKNTNRFMVSSEKHESLS